MLSLRRAGILPTTRIYNPLVPADLYDASVQGQSPRRKGPYVEFKYSGVLHHSGLCGRQRRYNIYPYASQYDNTTGQLRSPVVTDVFNKNQIVLNSESIKVGLAGAVLPGNEARPFRIDSQEIPGDQSDRPAGRISGSITIMTIMNSSGCRFCVRSAQPDMDFVNPDTPTNTLDAQRAQRFYENITQTAQPDRDYYKSFNANTFILISAGYDGVYGTKDDITNFNY